MATAANTAQVRKSSLPPAARTTIAGVSTMPPAVSTASCRPRPKARGAGGFSSASYRMPAARPVSLVVMRRSRSGVAGPDYGTSRQGAAKGEGSGIVFRFDGGHVTDVQLVD